MVVYNIWSFNAFYIFQIPYLLVLFVLALLALYWLDKRNIYQHYKMQTYLSIQLELSSQRDYLWMFLVCACGGYALGAIFYWQYVLAAGVCLLAGLANLAIGYGIRRRKREKEGQGQGQGEDKSVKLGELAARTGRSVKQSMVESMLEKEMRENLLLGADQVSAVSIGSVNLHFGYQEVYQSYLGQFRNRDVLHRLG